ncbi:MAG TPA: nucleotide disphospho-sugar-binding domain-containing protein [Blastocatellia bacterium]|nr:nucleotide disphospho-sugar-binding domain-containing protein [Blastocatellia bacterium]
MKLLFCPLASHGFVYPLIGIAKYMRSRGHEAVFVTGPAFSEALLAEGFDRVPRGAKDGPSFEVKTWFKPVSVAIQAKHIEYALERFLADALVTTQLSLGPLIISETRRIPVAVLGLATYVWPLWPLNHKPQSEKEERLQWRYGDMMGYYNKARSALGLSAIDRDHLMNPLLGDLFMVQSVPELEQNEYELPSKAHFVGSCAWEPESSDPDLSAWLDQCGADGEPLIYAQPGRSFDLPSYWPCLRDALRDKPLRLAAAIDRMDGEAGDVPGNFFVRGHVPQGKVLPRAAAVIGTGHTTSVLGALTHGLPSILLPSGSASDDIAEKCERAGAALCFEDAPMDVGFFEDAVNELLANRNLRRRAEFLRDAFAKAGGCSRAAALIEQMRGRARPAP